MSGAFELRDVTKWYDRDSPVAVDAVTVAIPRQSIVGLIGRYPPSRAQQVAQ